MTDEDRLFNLAHAVENAAIECDSVETAEFLIEIVVKIHALLGGE
jgi:hypothetical protein